MTNQQLKLIQQALQYTNARLAAILRTPLRTFESWRNGETRIAGAAEVALLLICQIRGIDWHHYIDCEEVVL